MNNQLGKKQGKNLPEANNSKGFFKSVKNLGSLDPLMSLAARSSYMRFSKDYQAEDVDKFKDQLIKLKEEVNKKRQEMTLMKIEYAKLEEDNNKNMKFIENFFTEAGKNVGEFLLGKNSSLGNSVQNNFGNTNDLNEEQLKKTQNETEVLPNDILNQAASMNVSANTFLRLREVYVINNLKKLISQLKKVLSAKEEEIETYKNNVRCAKYSKLEFNYSNNLNQLIQIKKENENLRGNYEEISSKYNEQIEENKKLINSLSIYRSQFDEIKIKNKILEDTNKELNTKNKYLEEKVVLLNKSIIHQPVQLARVSVREKNNMINRLKEEIQELKDKFKAEKQRLDKRIFYIAEDFRKVKEALDLKIFKKCQTDLISMNLKEESYKLINSLQANLKHQADLFENERNQLYDFIEKLSMDFQDIADKNSLKIEIPKFQPIPLPIEKEAELGEQNMQELAKNYEETEKHLVDVLNENSERLKYLSQIDIERHIKESSPNNKNSDNFFLTNNNFSSSNNLNFNNKNENNENFDQENFDSNKVINNDLNSNSKLNYSHASKHRLMNMNTERSQKLQGENEGQNNLSKISNNKLLNEKNESEKLQDENIIDKLNTSKYSKRSLKQKDLVEANELEEVKCNIDYSKFKEEDQDMSLENADDENNNNVNTKGEKAERIIETETNEIKNAGENKLPEENADVDQHEHELGEKDFAEENVQMAEDNKDQFENKEGGENPFSENTNNEINILESKVEKEDMDEKVNLSKLVENSAIGQPKVEDNKENIESGDLVSGINDSEDLDNKKEENLKNIGSENKAFDESKHLNENPEQENLININPEIIQKENSNIESKINIEDSETNTNKDPISDPDPTSEIENKVNSAEDSNQVQEKSSPSEDEVN